MWKRSLWLPFSFILLATNVACWRAAEPETEFDWERLGELPLSKQTQREPLQREFALLEAERATPVLLNAKLNAGPDATLEFVEIFSGTDLEALAKRLERMPSANGFRFSPLQLESLGFVNREYAARREAYRRAVHNAAGKFHFDHRRWHDADFRPRQIARIGNRLETFAAAEALRDGNLAEAVSCLRTQLRMCGRLAEVPNPEYRHDAVALRIEAFELLGAIVAHPKCTRQTQRELAALLGKTLERWPPLAPTWQGARAHGLLTYELTREGHLLSVLSPEQWEEIEREGRSRALFESVKHGLDDDQLYYLAFMRQWIEAADRPVGERNRLLDESAADLKEKYGGSEYPVVAGYVELPGIEGFHYNFVVDRAITEMWHLALQIAAGEPPEETPLDPLSGKPYRVEQSPERVTVESDLTDEDGNQISVNVAGTLRVP